MTLEANTDLLEIGDEYKDNIDATEINDFRISITNIERRTSTIFIDLCTWKASNTSTPSKDLHTSNGVDPDTDAST